MDRLGARAKGVHLGRYDVRVPDEQALRGA